MLIKLFYFLFFLFIQLPKKYIINNNYFFKIINVRIKNKNKKKTIIKLEYYKRKYSFEKLCVKKKIFKIILNITYPHND